MRNALQTLLALFGLVAGCWLGLRGFGPMPPLGQLLDPANGAWAAAARAELPPDAAAGIPGLSAAVEIRYDRRGVPHIFAASEEDAVRALGFVVARDRLFQLEAQSRAASGRIAEWAGVAALPSDQSMRELGLPTTAQHHLAALPTDGRARRILAAYADGVNAWIDAMSPRDWPIEYRLLGVRPERWSPINTLHLFGRMGWTLTYGAPEQRLAAAAALVGRPAAEALFPGHTPITEPIQPNGTGSPRFDFRPLPPPGAPDTAARRFASVLPGLPGLPGRLEPAPRFASNNWAVAPRRTAAGRALLAGDPHLQMTLPSLWYEAHLVVPGTLDVYGVTIPGAPGIVIGFNRDVAWSFTNTGADVLDLYRETVDDTANPTRYRVDDVWRPLDLRLEEYRGPQNELLALDTLRFTHRGPMSRTEAGEWVSMRWTVLEPVLSQVVFLDAAHARTARELLDIMATGFGAPAQNVIAADRSGSIAIRSTGHFPIRPEGSDGLDIFDGSRSGNDWKGFWPLERYPHSFDPPQGFLASANQEPIDPLVEPRYLGADSDFDPWRALHLNRLLRADSAVTPDAMRRYQTDAGSARADAFLPFFIDAAHVVRERGSGTALVDSAAAWLSSWDRRYTMANERALLFEAAMRDLVERTWDELEQDGSRVATPSSAMLLNLLQDGTSAWWDDRSTGDVVEDRDAIVAASLAAAWTSLVRQHGHPSSGAWAWSSVGATRLTHLLGLRGFSQAGIAIQGGPGTLNPASRGGHGPSWRMVVELGDSVRAWGTYPGGQSGNPFSDRYLDRLPFWREGQLDTLLVPRDTASLAAEVTRARLRLTPAGGGGR
jgi:penicillin amidase